MSETTDMGDPLFYELRNLLGRDMSAALKRIRANRSLLDVRSGLGETLLHWFAIEYREDIVKALADAGAEIDPVNKFGSTPLLEVVTIGNERMCRLLFSLGASPNVANDLGEQPLLIAARSGSVHKCRMLIEMGAQIDARDACDETAVSAAATSGQLELLQYFLDLLGPDFDVNTVFGDSAAHTIHQVGGHVGELLTSRGLRHPYELD